jgi:hypothetical protein
MVGEKIAVFAWSSAVEADEQVFIDGMHILSYISLLQIKGYTKFFKFHGSHTPLEDLYVVQRYETDLDEVFFCFICHGATNFEYSELDFTVRYGETAVYPLSSNVFRDEIIAGMETQKKAWLVDASACGGFTSNFWPDNSDLYQTHDFIAMTATDYVHSSLGDNGLRFFSYVFFSWVAYGNNAVTAFYNARGTLLWFVYPLWFPCPLIYDNSPYVFFD